MLGRTCRAKQTVWSPVLGRNVTRCARFAGGSHRRRSGLLGDIGALKLPDMASLKETAITGVFAVGGAFGSRRLGEWVTQMVKLDPTKKSYMYWKMLIEVLIGVGGGAAVAQLAKKPEIGAAIAIGPIVINGMELAGTFIAPKTAVAGLPPTYGYPAVAPQGLGVTVEQGQQVPEWMYSDYLNQVKTQYPSWAIG